MGFNRNSVAGFTACLPYSVGHPTGIPLGSHHPTGGSHWDPTAWWDPTEPTRNSPSPLRARCRRRLLGGNVNRLDTCLIGAATREMPMLRHSHLSDMVGPDPNPTGGMVGSQCDPSVIPLVGSHHPTVTPNTASLPSCIVIGVLGVMALLNNALLLYLVLF